MEIFRFTMRVLSALLSAYSFVIFLSILFSWIPTRSPGMMKVKYYINQVTNPYMNRFRGIPWLRFGNLDFSPLLALMLLYFAIFITGSLASSAYVSWWYILFWIVSYIWRLFTGLLIFFAIIMAIRLISLYAARGSSSSFLSRLDSFLFPVISRVLGFFTNRTIAYPMALGIVAVTFFAVAILSRWGMGKLLSYLASILNSR